MKNEHSPLPWVINIGDEQYSVDSQFGAVMDNWQYEEMGPSLKDAQFIVHCVNLHYELVDILEKLTRFDAPKRAIHRQLSGRMSQIGEVLETINKAREILEKLKGN